MGITAKWPDERPSYGANVFFSGEADENQKVSRPDSKHGA